MTLDERLKPLLAEEPLPGKRVLVHGCGAAPLGVWMAVEDAEVTFLDASRQAADAALEQARQAGAARRVKGILAENTVLDMFADYAFDVILLHGGTAFCWDEIARVLRPDGRLVSLVPVAGEAGLHLTRIRELKPERPFWKLGKADGPTLWTARRPGLA